MLFSASPFNASLQRGCHVKHLPTQNGRLATSPQQPRLVARSTRMNHSSFVGAELVQYLRPIWIRSFLSRARYDHRYWKIVRVLTQPKRDPGQKRRGGTFRSRQSICGAAAGLAAGRPGRLQKVPQATWRARLHASPRNMAARHWKLSSLRRRRSRAAAVSSSSVSSSVRSAKQSTRTSTVGETETGFRRQVNRDGIRRDVPRHQVVSKLG